MFQQVFAAYKAHIGARDVFAKPEGVCRLAHVRFEFGSFAGPQ